MERLTINIPDEKSSLVKQILKELGVTVLPENKGERSVVRKKLANISVWSDADLKVLEEGKAAFENVKPPQC